MYVCFFNIGGWANLKMLQWDLNSVYIAYEAVVFPLDHTFDDDFLKFLYKNDNMFKISQKIYSIFGLYM